VDYARRWTPQYDGCSKTLWTIQDGGSAGIPCRPTLVLTNPHEPGNGSYRYSSFALNLGVRRKHGLDPAIKLNH
jgi:hypothetical protein